MFDRLQSIIDTEDPRFEKLKSENMKFWEQGAAALCDSMNQGVDRFYARKSYTYDAINRYNNTMREEYGPVANESEITPELLDAAVRPWAFGALPATGLKMSTVTTETKQIGELADRLRQMRALDLWHEPIELLEAGEGLFSGLAELLLDLASKSEAVLESKPATPTGDEPKPLGTPRAEQSEQEIQDFFKLQSNAMQILFGLAVLTGGHELIVKALDAMHEFEQKSTKRNADEVFALCQPALKSYLGHIAQTAKGQPAYHAMASQHLSAVYGLGELYCTRGLSTKNTSITTDGTYLYLYIATSQRGRMYKLGTGEGGTVAGRRYVEVPTDREGDVTWVYCQGRLYSRRTNEEFGSLVIYDAATLKRLGDARLACGDLFGGNKQLKAVNASHPLLSDGEHLYTITFQVERRERKPNADLAAEAKALADHKRKEKEDKEKQAKKEA